jgi:hypothetical protein
MQAFAATAFRGGHFSAVPTEAARFFLRLPVAPLENDARGLRSGGTAD